MARFGRFFSLGDRLVRVTCSLPAVYHLDGCSLVQPRFDGHHSMSAGLPPVRMTLPGYDWTSPSTYDTSGL